MNTPAYEHVIAEGIKGIAAGNAGGDRRFCAVRPPSRPATASLARRIGSGVRRSRIEATGPQPSGACGK